MQKCTHTHTRTHARTHARTHNFRMLISLWRWNIPTMQLYLVPHWHDISDCYSDRQSHSVEACLSQTSDCTPTHQWPEPLSFNGSPSVSPVVVTRVPYSALYSPSFTTKKVPWSAVNIHIIISKRQHWHGSTLSLSDDNYRNGAAGSCLQFKYGQLQMWIQRKQILV